MNKILSIFLSTALVFITIAPGDSIAFAGNNNSSLAAQSRWKPSARIVKTADGFLILDDTSQADAARAGFKDDVDSVYLEVLRNQAQALGMSDDGLRSLIRAHAQKITAGRYPGESAQGGRPERATSHSYTEATPAEAERILSELKQAAGSDLKSRLAKLIEVYNAGKDAYELKLDLFDIATLNQSIDTKILTLTTENMFPNKLFRDENGVYWIMKRQREPVGLWVSGWKQNVRKREELASLLLKHTSNQVEIRKLSREDVQRSASMASVGDNADEYYMIRVIADGNMEQGGLPHKDPQQADSAIFVADILIRKYDPKPNNKVPFNGVPVSIDNDIALGFDRHLNPDERNYFKIFEFHFLLNFACITPAFYAVDWSKLAEGSGNKQLMDFFKELDFVAARSDPEPWISKMVSFMRKIGIGDSVFAANMLDEEYIRRSILEHKKLENVREAAIEAGYEGKELDEVVAMIDENRKTLGRDVNEILKAMTGKDYGLDKLDAEYEIFHNAKWGETLIDTLLLQARDAGQRNEKIIIGIDSSWIPIEQLPYIQGLLSELTRLSRRRGLDNVIILRENGAGLASVLAQEASQTGTPLSNMVILGGGNVLSHRAFDALRPGVDPKKWAFFAAVETPENFPVNSYIRLIEMLTVELNLAFGATAFPRTPYIEIVQEGPRMFRFKIPKAEPMDYETLKEIYNRQIKVMTAA